jgi:hypothetical protein
MLTLRILLAGILTLALGSCGGMAADEPTAGDLGTCDSEWMAKQIKKGVGPYGSDGPWSVYKLSDIWQDAERSEVDKFLARINLAKDQTEFDQLMAERRKMLHDDAQRKSELKCYGKAWFWSDRHNVSRGASKINWTMRWTTAEKTNWQIEVSFLPYTSDRYPVKLQGTLAAPAKLDQ